MSKEGMKDTSLEDGLTKNFPVGMRVLAVDDDHTCLFWLNRLLKQCNYEVTTTDDPREAIEILRANKTLFDIVVTDVRMPNIDGFKLLEIVGREMDIPVIMISSYNDVDIVKEGVDKGAVDYLLKPLRKEEMQNIWQHVLRKRRNSCKDQKDSPRQEKPSPVAANAVPQHVEVRTVNVEQTTNKRHQDQMEKTSSSSEDANSSGRENEESTSRKRPRVVWSVELHKKFVEAVDLLGIDKAVPKKILDIMEVEGLTRENVASHLQKYRLYLKRTASNAQPQNLYGALALAARTSFDGMREYSSGRLPSFSSFPSLAFEGRVNSGSGMNHRSISASDLIQSGQNLRNSINRHVGLPPNVMSSNQNSTSYQSVQGGFEQNPLHANNNMNHVGQFHPGRGAARFAVSDNNMDPKMMINGSSSSCIPSQFAQQNPSSVCGTYKTGGVNGQVNTWKMTAELPETPQRTFQKGEGSSQHQIPMNNAKNGISVTGSQQPLLGFQQIAAPAGDSLFSMQADSSMMGNNGFQSNPGWDQNKQIDNNQELNNVFSNLNPLHTNGIMGALGIDQNGLVAIGGDITAHIQGTPSTVSHTNGFTGSDPETDYKNLESYIPDPPVIPQYEFMRNTGETMEDILNAMMSSKDNDGPSLMYMDGSGNCNSFSPSSRL